MKRYIAMAIGAVLVSAGVPSSEALARGFGARGGGVAVGGRGGVAAGGYRGGAAVGAYGGYHAGGARTGSYVGPRGTTVQAGRAGGVAVGPAGGVHAAGAQGVKVTTPGGRTFTDASAGRAGVGPYGGVHAGGIHAGAATGPFGGVAAGRMGGIAVGPGGVRIAGGGAAVAGHSTRYYSPTALRAQGAYIRGGYYHGAFTAGWIRGYPNGWWPGRWRYPNWWIPPVWTGVAAYCGISEPPIVYDYGSNVVIENNNVYLDGNQYATADQYAQQATQISDAGRAAQPAKDDEWQSLGVFGMVQGEENTAQHLFQLAVNKAGVVRGNYYDAVADTTLPVYGSVDKKTQRVAWSIGDKKTIVYEAGLQNLTEGETSVLIHYGTDRTQQMMLVRLEQPKASQTPP
jgi:hypothetical protein